MSADTIHTDAPTGPQDAGPGIQSDRARAGCGFDYSIPQDQASGLFYAVHFGRNGKGRYCEIRFKRLGDGRFDRLFIPGDDTPAIMAKVADLAPVADVYVGVLARLSMSGKAEACAPSRLAFVDLDTPESIERAMGYMYRPNIVIETSPGHAQAYWDLCEWIEPRFVRPMNLRLAHHFGGDLNACDAARIFRPPGSVNHKYEPAHPVRCVHVEASVNLPTARQLVGDLPAPESERPKATVPARIRPIDGGDVLTTIPASVYVPVLTGRDTDSTGKVRCPWHKSGQERTPSLHAYDDPAKGWFCWGCDDGGDIFTFAARLWSMDSRREFPEVKRRLLDALIAAGRGAAA